MAPERRHPLVGALTPLQVFADAPLAQQFIMLVLLAAMIAALIVMVLKVRRGPHLSGGSAFLSGLRIGGPIIGLLGACDAGLNMTIGVVNAGIDPTLRMLAPGIAQSFMMVGIGFLVGAVAVVAHWAVEARIDRQVLGV
jgi:tellurite resistance protein TehA-like permease